MSTLLPEVWVWLSRAHDGSLHAHLPEALYETGALARRLGLPLVGVADRAPGDSERAMLALWQVAALRLVPGPLPPHPQIQAGRSPFANLGLTPRVFVLLANPLGCAVAPLAAVETGAALVTYATSLTADAKRHVAARPLLGGQYEALVELPLDEPLVVTLQAGSVGPVASGAGKAAARPALPVLGATPAALPRAAAPRVHLPDAAALAISDADRIVAFGRGAFSDKAVALVQRLAQLLGAAVAGTRPAADEGWLPFARQVGLTGAIVTPKLYVAVGISGAPYHLVGVKDPETLIAINSDPEAPIFASAHLGIVGDLHAVLPALIAQLEQGQPLAQALAGVHGKEPKQNDRTAKQ